MELAQIGPGSVVHLVVELRQADLLLETDLAAAGDEGARGGGDGLPLIVGDGIGPGEGLEGGGGGVPEPILKRRRLMPRPLGVHGRCENAQRVVIVEGEDIHCVACERPWLTPDVVETYAVSGASDVSAQDRERVTSRQVVYDAGRVILA